MKVKFLLLSLTMLSTTAVFASNATTAESGNTKSAKKENVVLMTKEQKAARFEAIKERVTEIKAMDKSQLSRDERRSLRHELRGLNRESHEVGTKSLAIVILGGAMAAVLLLLAIG